MVIHRKMSLVDRRLLDSWRGASWFLTREQSNRLILEEKGTRPLAPDGFHELWPYISPITAMDPWRAAGLARRLWEVRDLPGDVIECGGLAGGMTVMMARLLKHWGSTKRVYMLDAFQGLPAPGIHDAFYKQGEGSVPRAAADAFIHMAGVQDVVTVVPGWFHDTLPTLQGHTWCLAHLDGDMHDSTQTCLAHVPRQVCHGGVVVLDDCWDTNGGVRRAAEQHLRRTREQLHAGPVMQGYFRKGHFALDGNRRRVTPSLEELREDRPYRRVLQVLHGWMVRDARSLAAMRRMLDKRTM